MSVPLPPNERAVQSRKWANQIVKDYTIQEWTMVERLKRGGNLTDEFFERQLEKIREIRLSERKFYQKITDLYVPTSRSWLRKANGLTGISFASRPFVGYDSGS